MNGERTALIQKLLDSEEPSIRWKTKILVLGEDPNSKGSKLLQQEIKDSPRVRTLLKDLDTDVGIRCAKGVYSKWQGAHWILATLSDIGYPKGDKRLLPVAKQALDCWLGERFFQEFSAERKEDAYKRDAIPVMRGRHRTCASQQGYALYYLLRLGLIGKEAERLVERLLHWQWPDGGWNCDKDPAAATSTFIHTAISLRGLTLYAKESRDPRVQAAADRAAGILLERRLFKRRSSGKSIRDEFTVLHYPLYWHYDVLGALKIMAEGSRIGDERCKDALDLLERKELKEGGWAAEKKYYKVSQKVQLGADRVDWGPTGKTKMNEWITVDALAVLRAAKRLD